MHRRVSALVLLVGMGAGAAPASADPELPEWFDFDPHLFVRRVEIVMPDLRFELEDDSHAWRVVASIPFVFLTGRYKVWSHGPWLWVLPFFEMQLTSEANGRATAGARLVLTIDNRREPSCRREMWGYPCERDESFHWPLNLAIEAGGMVEPSPGGFAGCGVLLGNGCGSIGVFVRRQWTKLTTRDFGRRWDFTLDVQLPFGTRSPESPCNDSEE